MKSYKRRTKEKLEAYLDKHFEWTMHESPLVPEKVYIGRSEDDKGLPDYISNFFGEEVQHYICDMSLNDNLYVIGFVWVDDLGNLYADMLLWSKEDWVIGIKPEVI